uniref:Uncharacterized protein n=1 Tax=Tetraselmis chuii TaxID=63592 RepID=A0A7S1SNR8_9CHLO|mmetsp:Transcript_21528/g.38354  ORF Transcript_21528/g.38354 Transcript_21528/m.38354 type:complete len:476 (+) Transcript_21528:129-1556(+)
MSTPSSPRPVCARTGAARSCCRPATYVSAAARPSAHRSATPGLFARVDNKFHFSGVSGSSSIKRRSAEPALAAFEQAERHPQPAASIRGGEFDNVASPAASSEQPSRRSTNRNNTSSSGADVNSAVPYAYHLGESASTEGSFGDSLLDSQDEGYGERWEEDPGAAYEARLEFGRAAGELGALSVDDYYFMQGRNQNETRARGMLPGGSDNSKFGRFASAGRETPSGSRNNISAAGSLQTAANERVSRASSRTRRGYPVTSEYDNSSGQERRHWRPADLGPKPKHDWPAAQAHLPPEPQPVHNTGRLMVTSSSAELPPAERTFNARVRQCMHAVQVGDVQTHMTQKMSQAVDSYTDALRLHSLAAATMLAKRAEAHAGVAEERQLEGVSTEATTCWEACLSDATAACSLDPGLEMGYFWKGQALLKLGKVHRAADAFHDGLRINPLHDQLREGLDAVHSEASSLISDPPGQLSNRC